MEFSVKERLKSFLKHHKIKNIDFCNSIGVSQSFISSMRESIQPEKLKSIALNYPELNISWLLTGLGEMINMDNTDSETKQTGDPVVYHLAEKNMRLEEEIVRYRKLDENRKNTMLLMEKYEKELNRLVDQVKEINPNKDINTIFSRIESLQSELKVILENIKKENELL